MRMEGCGCESWIRRVSQVLTDSGGNFDFDFVMAGISYSISATDTSGLSDAAIRVIMDSTIKDAVDRQRIEELANRRERKTRCSGCSPPVRCREAIAKVEGLDRALVRDLIPIGSSREGQNVPIALRFRGRATVIGQIVVRTG